MIDDVTLPITTIDGEPLTITIQEDGLQVSNGIFIKFHRGFRAHFVKNKKLWKMQLFDGEWYEFFINKKNKKIFINSTGLNNDNENKVYCLF